MIRCITVHPTFLFRATNIHFFLNNPLLKKNIPTIGFCNFHPQAMYNVIFLTIFAVANPGEIAPHSKTDSYNRTWERKAPSHTTTGGPR